ncbi:MAG: hypothetical protein IT378_03785 [Sandaracinaceae bacterium]|nr:hypothetical protein [Sandaracinaceae bacterium]
MSGGGHGGDSKTWIVILVAGLVLCGAGYGMHYGGVELPGWILPLLFAIGGLMVIFGSCEAMILSVEGLGTKLGWNRFVAGAIATLASNVPEIIMLGFVVAAEPRVAFVVVALTLHVNALVFGVYSGVLPRDERGHARLPTALVRTSTDLFLSGGGALLATGTLMVVMQVFQTGEHQGEGFGAVDLAVIGGCLLMVQVVSVRQMIKQFAGKAGDAKPEPEEGEDEGPPPSWGKVVGFGALGLTTSVVGGHAVGDFADALVLGLTDAGYSEMIGAIVLSVFAGAGAFVMTAMAHFRKMYDIALANISGAITQVPFVVLPAVMIIMAVLAFTGVIPTLPSGAVLSIDLETTSVILLAFPPMLILWKSVQDDGAVNWVETAGMVAVFGLTIYFLAVHG